GVLMKLGAFGIIRLGIQLLPAGAEFWMPGLLVLGTVNALYGSMSALAQRDFKQMIGYSSVSHMGYVIMGLATLNLVGIQGAVLQMFAHGVMTALFFAMVGALYDQAHTREMSVFGGLAGKMPLFSIFFILAGLSASACQRWPASWRSSTSSSVCSAPIRSWAGSRCWRRRSRRRTSSGCSRWCSLESSTR